MVVEAKTICKVLDSDMSNDRKVPLLAAMAMEDAGGFWDTVSVRSLGRKRMTKLGLLSSLAAASPDEATAAFGQYANLVFETWQGGVETAPGTVNSGETAGGRRRGRDHWRAGLFMFAAPAASSTASSWTPTRTRASSLCWSSTRPTSCSSRVESFPEAMRA